MEPELTYPSFSLEDRKALVTGASRGIGRALALGLAQAGATVALGGRDISTLKKTAAEIETLGRKAHLLTLDVTKVETLGPAVEACTQVLGGLDILVNNAGTEKVRDSLEIDSELWDYIVNTNLKGAFFCAQAAGRVMVRTGQGSIINICSLTSSVGVPTAVPYTSSKTGLLGMTRALSAEWAPKGVRVNAIAPGYFRTALTDVFFQNDQWRQSMEAKIPMGRFGHVQDLIGAAVFLAGDASKYLTGQMLTIDGGYLAAI
jgi:NAD(P)-dependent dehydrogenase (short-subunit alcohol dehydrogenase family)